MRIYKTDNNVTIAAKKAAMICNYAIHNPLHVFFEDRNFHLNPVDFEKNINEKFRKENGERMYQFVKDFLDEFEFLNAQERRAAYRLYFSKGDYLGKKWHEKILVSSNPIPPGGGLSYKRYLKEDGHIYIKTDKDIELLQF